ncbi:exocyst complex component sec8 [Pisolithus marmoratus]|nr:exocyst complex component sec8 [Pisolithus marmoratus]
MARVPPESSATKSRTVRVKFKRKSSSLVVAFNQASSDYPSLRLVPVTPSNNTFAPSSPKGPIFSSPKGPPSDYSTAERASTSSRLAYDYNGRDRRDSSSTIRSDASASHRYHNGSLADNRPRLDLSRSSMDEVPTTSPVSIATSPALSAVMAAFKDAGARKRGMTDESNGECERERKAEMERQKSRQERIRERMPGRRPTGKAKAGDIDAVLDEIKDEWEFVIDPDFNIVDLALALLDGSSSGKNLDSFKRTKATLSQALKGSVDKHYKAFADALPHHSALLNHLGLAQTQVKETRIALQEAKEALGSRRADLVQLWSRGQMLEEMIRLLDDMLGFNFYFSEAVAEPSESEHLKSVPDVLETLISEKRLIQAAALLIRSLKLINKPDMQEIGAISDVRSYLTGQESALRDILIDELHNHLYLKSFWCETRWAAYTPNQRTVTKVAFEDEPARPDVPSVARTVVTSFPQNSQTTRLSRYLSSLASRPNDPPHDLNGGNLVNHGATRNASMSSSSTTSQSVQANVNPEADSFAYIEMLLESLAILGKLGNTLDTVVQRLPSEIYALVESTVSEVEERAEQSKRNTLILSTGAGSKSEGGYIFTYNPPLGMDSAHLHPAARPSAMLVSSLRLVALELPAKQADHEILKDLFWTVFSKLDAVTQGLRVVFEVSNRIGLRRDFKDSSGAKTGALFSIADVWGLIQAEVRTLLHDYLTDEERSSVAGRNPIASINEVLREGHFTRDKLKAIFRFTDSDIRTSTKVLRRHEGELLHSLRDTMPGLAQSSSESTIQTAPSTITGDDHTPDPGQHHRLLIKPDAFHVSVLFQPTLTFLSRMTDVLPHDMDNSRSMAEVLDDFVLKVYLPQLEEKVSLLFHHAISDPDAFQPDILSTRFSPKPLLKVTTQIMALINSLCIMLRTTPFHQESYSRLIIGVIIQLYQRCSDRLHVLVSREQQGGTPRVSLAAQWAQRPELNACLLELYMSMNASVRESLCRQETHLEMSLLGQGTVNKDDLVVSAWFIEQLNNLKSSRDGVLSPGTASRSGFPSVFTPFTPSPFLPVFPPISEENEVNLPLSREMAMRFSALQRTYTQLAEMILHTIRIEVRCRTMYHLDAAFRLGNYQIDHEVGEPDRYIVDLNAELSKIDECVISTLLKEEQDFVFCGLEDLVEHLLIANARHIRSANNVGIKKVMRNILALQQSIRSVGGDGRGVQLERARVYYSLFSLGPQGLLDSVRSKNVFSFDEYKVMLDLQCGVDANLGDAAAAKATDPNHGLYVIELHGLELENSAETDSNYFITSST